MNNKMSDYELRLVVFEWLNKQTLLYPGTFPRKLLEEGFIYHNIKIPLVGPPGIFKPKSFELPLSITTTSSGRYDDSISPDSFLSYRYRGDDPQHRDNIGLRQAMEKNVPLVYFFSSLPSKYIASWPVYIINDNVEKLTFTVAVDDMQFINKVKDSFVSRDITYKEAILDRRAYITSKFQQRLHQQHFHDIVLDAYRYQCACCRLRHTELLDAAHIIADKEPEGLPIVNNGLALCKLHHAAFDSNIIGISSDYDIHVRKDVLEEEDGPMLNYGLQKLEGGRIILPRKEKSYPDKILLDKRFQMFKNV
jgi:putative restriction endonuclease